MRDHLHLCFFITCQVLRVIVVLDLGRCNFQGLFRIRTLPIHLRPSDSSWSVNFETGRFGWLVLRVMLKLGEHCFSLFDIVLFDVDPGRRTLLRYLVGYLGDGGVCRQHIFQMIYVWNIALWPFELHFVLENRTLPFVEILEQVDWHRLVVSRTHYWSQFRIGVEAAGVGNCVWLVLVLLAHLSLLVINGPLFDVWTEKLLLRRISGISQICNFHFRPLGVASNGHFWVNGDHSIMVAFS